ncbi:MAG: isochorismate synthase [Planctomycetota bacterium]
MNFGVHTRPVSANLTRLAESLNALNASKTQYPLAIRVPVNNSDPWQWLRSNAGLPRIAWADRDGEETTTGIGIATEVVLQPGGEMADCINQCRQLLNGNDQLKFYGGFSFDGNDAWHGFGAGRFVVPRLSVGKRDITLSVMNRDDIAKAKLDLEQINAEQDSTINQKFPNRTGIHFSPSFDGWQSRIDEALSLIRNEVLEKIVLSRKAILEFSEPIDPVALSECLGKSTTDCFIFCFNFDHASAFVGATPERLFRRLGNRLDSEVIAGTRMRGNCPAEDERLAIELLTSDKDQREHDIVRKSIRQKLHKFVDHLNVADQASILRLVRKQHLKSEVTGELKSGVDDGMLLKRLHPTPAVGGYPTDNALPEIARIEPFNRGWYAAPVGWVGADSAQFAVAIRSGLIESNRLSIFSGAGIVRGSEPEQEWREVENKIQDFLSVLDAQA